MGLKFFFSLLFIIFVIMLLVLYWFIPFTTIEFIISSRSSDFEFGNLSNQKLQFYENMRFAESRISYNIGPCPLQKKNDMLRAFEILSEKTDISFYEIEYDEDISIFCDSRNKIEEGLFIAGEGGPTNITKSGEFNVISKGRILLFKESSCPQPNVAIHEPLHVLGFDHLLSPKDIMYKISKCGQTINTETINLINTLYSVPSYPDLVFGNVSAVMQGKYLDVNLSVRNSGLQDSIGSFVEISADDKLVKEIEITPLRIGHGRIISLTNVWISKINIDKLNFVIKSDFEELKKENNIVVLEIKK